MLVALSVQAQQTIPFVLQDNLIRLEAVIDGKPFTGVLDSGAGYVGLSPATGTSLGLTGTGSALDVAQVGKSTLSAQPVTIPRLTAGPFDLHDIDGIVIDMHQLSRSAGFEIDALLGSSMFEQHAVRVDYPRRALTLMRPDAQTSCPNPIPFELRAGVPVVTAQLRHGKNAAQTVHLVVDLGTRHFAMMLASHVALTPIGRDLSMHGHAEQVGTGIGGPLAGVTAQLDEFQLAGVTFNDTRISLSPDLHVSPEIADGSLGVPLWVNGIITFDYRNKTICLERN